MFVIKANQTNNYSDYINGLLMLGYFASIRCAYYLYNKYFQ